MKSFLVFILTLFFITLSNGDNSTQLFASSGLLTNQYVNITINVTNSRLIIAFSGPTSYWHGIGFGSTSMSNTYAIIVNGNGTYQERKLGNHQEGTLLTSSILNASSIVNNNIITTTLVRALTGITSSHYTFSSTLTSLSIIYAQGSTSSFNGAVHKTEESKKITFSSSSTPTNQTSDAIQIYYNVYLSLIISSLIMVFALVW